MVYKTAMASSLKLALLLSYLSVLFLLARLREGVSWYGYGQMSPRHLDAATLPVNKLKALLAQRGVSYDKVVEKSELEQLVKASGTINEVELEQVTPIDQADFPVTNFTKDFYEQLKDANGNIWLFEIMADTRLFLSDTMWRDIRRNLGMFGIRFGRFNCKLNARLCSNRQWFTSRLVLALQEIYHGKDYVAFHSYYGQVTVNPVVRWMQRKLHKQIKPIHDLNAFQNSWLKFDSSLTPDIRVVFVSSMTSVPLFLSALSVKFQDGVKFGSIDTNTRNGKQLVKKAGIEATPAYLLLTRDVTYIYGSEKGETLTLCAMEMFLNSFYPSLTDLIIISIVCTNIANLFEISLVKGRFIRRLGKYLICAFKYNLNLMLAWIVLPTIFQLPYFDVVGLVGLKLLRLCAATTFVSFIRKDVVYYMSNLSLPLVVAGLLIVLVAYVKSRYFKKNLDEEEENDLIYVFQCIVILLLAWVALLTIFQLPIFDDICLVGQKLLRTSRTSTIFSFIRTDVMYYMGNLTVSMVVAGVMVVLVTYFTKNVEEDREISSIPVTVSAGGEGQVVSSGEEEEHDFNITRHSYDGESREANSEGEDVNDLHPSNDSSDGESREANSEEEEGNDFNPINDSVVWERLELDVDGEEDNDWLRPVPLRLYLRSVDRTFTFPRLDGRNVLEMSRDISEQYIKLLPCWYFREPEAGSEAEEGRYEGNPCEGTAGSLIMGNHSCEDDQDDTCPQHEEAVMRCIHDVCITSNDETGDMSAMDQFQEITKAYAVEPLNICRYKPEGYSDSSQCVICQQEYCNMVLVRGLPCGHVFHSECIGAWLLRESDTCPVCRFPANRPINE